MLCYKNNYWLNYNLYKKEELSLSVKEGGVVLSLLLVDVSPIVNSKDEPSFRSQEKDSIGLDFQKKGGDPLVCLV